VMERKSNEENGIYDTKNGPNSFSE
jgi:hypothetical protein